MQSEKKILLVDDRPETLGVFLRKFKEKQIEIDWVETLDSAVDYIKNNSGEIAGIIIDLHIHGISKVARFEQFFEVSINKGQSLGLFLREKYPKLKYFYLSNVTGSYSRPTTLPEGEKELIFSKAETSPDKLIELCREYFNFQHTD